MTAREYLSEIVRLKWRLKLAQEAAKNYHIAYSSMRGIDYSADKVQSSPKNALEAAGWRMLQDRESAQRAVKAYADEIAVRIGQINGLDDPDHISVLYKTYYAGETAKKIASEEGKTVKTIRNKISEALSEFAKKYPDVLQ